MQGAQIGAGGLSPLAPLTLTTGPCTGLVPADVTVYSSIIRGMEALHNDTLSTLLAQWYTEVVIPDVYMVACCYRYACIIDKAESVVAFSRQNRAIPGVDLQYY